MIKQPAVYSVLKPPDAGLNIFVVRIFVERSRGSSVSTVTGRSSLSHPSRRKWFFSSPNRPYHLCSPPLLPVNGYRLCFLEVKRPGPKFEHSLPSSAELKNQWNFTSTCLHGVDRDLTFLFLSWFILNYHILNIRVLINPWPDQETSSEACQGRARFQQHRDASCHYVDFPTRQGAEGNSRHSDKNISLFPSWSG